MDGTPRQPARSAARSTLLLSSVLALLAFACFPVLAQAADSAGAQYETALSGPGNKKPSKKSEQIAESSESQKGNGGASAPTGGGSGGSGESGRGSYTEGPSSGSRGAGAATGENGGTGQGSPDHGSTPKHAKPVQPAAPTTASAPAPDNGGGSSPLVPILIGILALAAISVAAFMIRQRRQRDGGSHSSLSTKAG